MQHSRDSVFMRGICANYPEQVRSFAGPLHEDIESMNVPKNILVPVDFSEYAEHALDYAIQLAAKLEARVHVLNVIGFPALGVPELGMALSASMMESIVKDNQAALDKLVDARRANAQFGEVMLRTGDARDVIVRTCSEVQADLIVMGTHGRRGVSRALLGSVAEGIVRTAPCPVLTIRKALD
jgi:nucleotide-binding universal stress UspA family protein